MVRSFILTYRAKVGLLVGGVKESESCRYQRLKDAKQRLASIQEANGKDNVEYIFTTCQKSPEIFVHCEGSEPTAIGCLCPKCKKLLTVKDARKARPEAD